MAVSSAGEGTSFLPYPLTARADGRFDISHLPKLFADYKVRYVDRDSRWMVLDSVVRGEYDQVDPEEGPLISKSPNLIQVALEDTAEAAALMPTVRVKPAKAGPVAKNLAARMERVATGYFDASRMDFIVNQTVMDLAGFGMACWVVWPDAEQRLPIIEKRDPRFCYPQPGYRPGDRVKDCLFARDVYLTQLDPAHVEKIAEVVNADGLLQDNARVVIVEYFTDKEVVIGALYQYGTISGSSAYIPIELDRMDLLAGVCPVVLGSRFTFDGEFRGQFDQVVGVLLAHVRLMGMVLDYADQAVYSDIWVRDLIGEMPYGGGGYIELGPQGSIGRVPPAVTSLNIQQDLSNLVDAIHLGGRWPKSRPGEIDQAIASAKFLEATAGMMNTAIKTYHQILKRMMEQSLRIAFITDRRYFPGPKSISGILRNQEFLEDYDATKDIDLSFQIRAEYGLGLGRDPSQSAVLMLQYAQGKFISNEFVQENIEGLTDVARENARIDVEQMRDMARAKLLQGLQDGSIPEDALVKIAQARADGEDLFQLYDKYVLKPRAQSTAGQMQSGIGPPVMPGPQGPGPGGPAGPGAPGQSGPGPAPPPPPAMPQLLQRLGVPAGPGGLLGSTVKTGG
jgi:hypothetical protein